MVYFLFEDGNSELKGRCFPLGRGIRKHLENTLNTYNGDKSCLGYKRLNNILAMTNGIEYNELKRIKNFFDNFQGDTESPEYILNGGDPMKLWVNNTLNTATSAIRYFKQAKKDAGLENAFRPPHYNRKDKPSVPTVPEIQTTNTGKNIADNTPVKYESVTKKTIIISEEQARLITEGAIKNELLKTRYL